MHRYTSETAALFGTRELGAIIVWFLWTTDVTGVAENCSALERCAAGYDFVGE